MKKTFKLIAFSFLLTTSLSAVGPFKIDNATTEEVLKERTRLQAKVRNLEYGDRDIHTAQRLLEILDIVHPVNGIRSVNDIVINFVDLYKEYTYLSNLLQPEPESNSNNNTNAGFNKATTSEFQAELAKRRNREGQLIQPVVPTPRTPEKQPQNNIGPSILKKRQDVAPPVTKPKLQDPTKTPAVVSKASQQPARQPKTQIQTNNSLSSNKGVAVSSSSVTSPEVRQEKKPGSVRDRFNPEMFSKLEQTASTTLRRPNKPVEGSNALQQSNLGANPMYMPDSAPIQPFTQHNPGTIANTTIINQYIERGHVEEYYRPPAQRYTIGASAPLEERNQIVPSEETHEERRLSSNSQTQPQIESFAPRSDHNYNRDSTRVTSPSPNQNWNVPPQTGVGTIPGFDASFFNNNDEIFRCLEQRLQRTDFSELFKRLDDINYNPFK